MIKKYIAAIFFSCFCIVPSFAEYTPTVGSQRTFLISAYYSPLPDQKEYVWGSYEADIRVNGQGIAGADGTGVYVGMIAAPKNYPFGTKISIPGLGIGAVHDRGGAILASKNIDRLDIWMGYGDEGRVRALNWGMRTVQGEIVGNQTKETLGLPGNKKITIPESIPTPKVEPKEKVKTENTAVKVVSSQKKISSKKIENTLTEGDSGDEVAILQSFLQEKGFLEENPSGFFGPKTKQAVILFQEFYRIIPYEDAPGAGIVGPKTRSQMELVWEEQYDITELPSIPQIVSFQFENISLQKGESHDHVKKLQMALQGLGYFTQTPNGVFGPATEKAVFQFQKDHALVGDENSLGAGMLGPKTGKKIDEVMKKNKINIIAESKQELW